MKCEFSIVIADDHPVFRAGLKQIISSTPGFSIVSEAADGEEALAMIRQETPHIALLDFDLPKLNGLEIARRLRKENSSVSVIILTMHNAETLLNESLDIGVCGYLLKDNASVDIVKGLRTVADGGVYISPAMSVHLVNRIQRSTALATTTPGIDDLTPTERRVLKQLAEGKTSKEIGQQLFISHRTVDTHRRNISEKLGLHGSNRLIQFAIENREGL